MRERHGQLARDPSGIGGEHQDAVVAEAWLRDAATPAGAARALVAGELIGAQRAEAAACRRQWREVWEKASKKKLRSWMA